MLASLSLSIALARGLTATRKARRRQFLSVVIMKGGGFSTKQSQPPPHCLPQLFTERNMSAAS
jgi:hypothetical protein